MRSRPVCCTSFVRRHTQLLAQMRAVSSRRNQIKTPVKGTQVQWLETHAPASVHALDADTTGTPTSSLAAVRKGMHKGLQTHARLRRSSGGMADGRWRTDTHITTPGHQTRQCRTVALLVDGLRAIGLTQIDGPSNAKDVCAVVRNYMIMVRRAKTYGNPASECSHKTPLTFARITGGVYLDWMQTNTQIS